VSDYVTLDIPPYILDALNRALCAAEENHVPRRERIATAALQGLLAGEPETPTSDNTYWYSYPDRLAQKATAIADALIAELDKPAMKPTSALAAAITCKNPRCEGGRIPDGGLGTKRCPDCTSPTMPRFDEP
jgi:hypothetical protein